MAPVIVSSRHDRKDAMRKLNVAGSLSAVCLMVLSTGLLCAEQTWHLKPDGSWQSLENNAAGESIMAVAAVKQSITSGDIDRAGELLAKLKQEYPDIAGPDMDTFMAGEAFYAEGKWVKAVRKYDEMLDGWPDSWLYDSAIEREYSVAMAFLQGQKRQILKILKLSAHEEGAKIMHGIADRAGDAPIAKRALTTLARSYEKRRLYLDAYETWSDISTRWPHGEMGQKALLEMAQSLHSAYRGPNFDHTSLISARSYYTNYNLRYPGDAQQQQIEGRQETIRQQVAYKQFAIGRYYEKTDNPQAARLYYRMVVDNWPGSTAAKMAQARTEQMDAAQQGLTKADRPKRPVFNATNTFLDNWFGLANLMPNTEKKNTQD